MWNANIQQNLNNQNSINFSPTIALGSDRTQPNITFDNKPSNSQTPSSTQKDSASVPVSVSQNGTANASTANPLQYDELGRPVAENSNTPVNNTQTDLMASSPSNTGASLALSPTMMLFLIGAVLLVLMKGKK